MQLKDRHNGDARFSEIREKIVLQEAGQTEGVFILEEVSLFVLIIQFVLW